MTDWREERYTARYSTDELFKDVIDSALPNESTSVKQIPEYMIDFYEETCLTKEWLQISDNLKKIILDADIKQYMQKTTQQ